MTNESPAIERADEPTIIVGVDGSAGSFRALDWAASAAARRRLPLFVMVCHTVPLYGEPGALGPTAVEAEVEAIRNESEDILHSALARARTIDSSIKASGQVSLNAPAVAIPGAAGPDDVIVIGTSGRTGVIAGLLGSVATSICHRAHVPVIVVPMPAGADENDPLPPPERVTPRKIVVGVDGSERSKVALHWAWAVTRRTAGELVVVHAWQYPYAGWRSETSEAHHAMRFDAQRELEAMVATLEPEPADSGITIRAELVEENTVKALIDEGTGADLLVVGSRGRGGFKALLLGSVSRSVVQHAPCPVAVIRNGSGEP
jgi:nucleotide-binding universal stress UspA family protein